MIGGAVVGSWNLLVLVFDSLDHCIFCCASVAHLVLAADAGQMKDTLLYFLFTVATVPFFEVTAEELQEFVLLRDRLANSRSIRLSNGVFAVRALLDFGSRSLSEVCHKLLCDLLVHVNVTLGA